MQTSTMYYFSNGHYLVASYEISVLHENNWDTSGHKKSTVRKSTVLKIALKCWSITFLLFCFPLKKYFNEFGDFNFLFKKKSKRKVLFFWGQFYAHFKIQWKHCVGSTAVTLKTEKVGTYIPTYPIWHLANYFFLQTQIITRLV